MGLMLSFSGRTPPFDARVSDEGEGKPGIDGSGGSDGSDRPGIIGKLEVNKLIKFVNMVWKPLNNEVNISKMPLANSNGLKIKASDLLPLG